MNKKIFSTTCSAAVACAVALSSGQTNATTFLERKFECPIGGEEFEARVVASNSSYGQRPDGKPYGPLSVYPVVECPENGFLLFDTEFTEEELSALEAAIQSAEYRQMRDTETPHFRVSWLKDKAGRDEVSRTSSLLQATWETDDDPARKDRYQATFVEAATALERTLANAETWFWFNLRAVNALRELGRYEEARELLSIVMSEDRIPKDTEAAENARYLGTRLGELLDEENPISQPTNLVPTDVAKFRCVVPEIPLSPAEDAACRGEEIQAAIADFQFHTEDDEWLRGADAIRAAIQHWRKRTVSKSE